ncbi:MAG: amidase [Alphaproteobacteria bacterium]|nr:amidase [Alphaproteobacteria bacterium]
MPDLAFKPATELARMISSKKLSARELLDHYAKRIEQHNQTLNAIVVKDLASAEARADEADAATARGESWGPLHGVPMTIKDAFEVKGLASSGGAEELKDHMPQNDADPVARLRAAGAIILGKTNVPLYSGDWQTYNELYGRTNNPWDLGRTPGGSSGGAAAALSAGLVAAEIGSDIGGSIRVPANFCGLYGHKPSFGTVSPRGHIPPAPHGTGVADLGVTGPLGRSVDDLQMLLGVMAGAAPADKALSVDFPPVRPVKRIAVWSDDPFAPVDSEVKGAVETAARALADAGCELDFEARPEVGFEQSHANYSTILLSIESSHATYLTLLSSIISSDWTPTTLEFMREHARTAPADATDDLTLQARGTVLTYGDYLSLNSKREAFKAQWAKFFETYDALLCPVTAVPAFAHDTERRVPDRRIIVNGQERPYMELLRWAGLATVCHLPASAAPVGLSKDGLPLGVQIIGPQQEDLTPLAVAAMLEAELGGFVPPPEFA